MHWRLQSLVAASTFVIFPLLGILSIPMWNAVLGPDLCMGMLYVCMLPSTVQSSIAFTSMAGGNVAAAICSASVSSLLGVFLTPLLVGLVWSRGGGGRRGFLHLPEHLLHYPGAVRGRADRPALDRQVGGGAQERHLLDGPQHDLAGHLHGIQPRHGQRRLEEPALAFPGGSAGVLRSSAGRRPLADGFSFPAGSVFRGKTGLRSSSAVPRKAWLPASR